jgi:D-sedoheptulose 7-phosphate isomerase
MREGTMMDKMTSQDGLAEYPVSAVQFLEDYARYVASLITRIDANAVSNIVKCFYSARERGATIFFAGNGGSAATASHFAQDLGEVGRKSGGHHFRSLSLTDNASFITAVGNDYGYDKIFTKQMQNLFQKGDILVAISASGNSSNILAAVELAKKLGGITIGLVGFDGGSLAKICDHVVHVVSGKGEYGPVEDMHMMIGHMIASCLMSYPFEMK